MTNFKKGDQVVWTPRNSYGLDFGGQSYSARITDVWNGRYQVQRELPAGDCHWGGRDESELVAARCVEP